MTALITNRLWKSSQRGEFYKCLWTGHTILNAQANDCRQPRLAWIGVSRSFVPSLGGLLSSLVTFKKHSFRQRSSLNASGRLIQEGSRMSGCELRASKVPLLVFSLCSPWRVHNTMISRRSQTAFGELCKSAGSRRRCIGEIQNGSRPHRDYCRNPVDFATMSVRSSGCSRVLNCRTSSRMAAIIASEGSSV